MVSVFQTETGGTLDFAIPTSVPAVSGFLYVVDRSRSYYRLDGVTASGYLYIAKSGLSNFTAGDYVGLPQVIDIDNKVYFLEPEDIQIVEVPDFFSSAVLTTGDSVLVRLTALESISAGYITLIANATVQSSKFVVLVGNGVEHADSRILGHAGRVVGISQNSAGVGDPVTTQILGVHTSQLSPFSVTGPVLLGYNGGVVSTLPSDAAFAQHLGIVEDAQTMILSIDAQVHIL